MNRFTARKAEDRDVDAIVHIQRVAVEKAWAPIIKENFDVFLREKFDPETQTKKYAERIHDPARILVVVETADPANQQVVGFGGAQQHKAGDQPLGFEYQGKGFYLDPAFEGTGASLILGQGLMAELHARNVKSICGWCLADNRMARNFYEKRGGKLITDAIAPPDYAIAPHVAYGWVF